MQKSLPYRLVQILTSLILAQSFVFSSIANQTIDYPAHSVSLGLNLAQAPSLSRSSIIPEGAQNQTANFYSPFTYAYFRILAASPSIDNRISAHNSTSVFFAWGESHAKFLTSSIPGSKQCGDGYATLTSQGDAEINGTMHWKLLGKEYLQEINSQTKNPIQIPIPASDWQAIFTARGDNNSAILPDLGAYFEGNISAPYSYYKREYLYIKDNGAAGGVDGSGGAFSMNDGYYCRLSETSAKKLLSMQVNDSRSWAVEHGKPIFFRISPIGGEQLAFQPKAEFSIMASQQPLLIELKDENGSVARANFAKYYHFQDEFGLIGIKRIPKAGDDAMYFSRDSGASIFANSTSSYLVPTHIDSSNTGYAWQYYSSLNSRFPAGKYSLAIRMMDEFGNSYSKNYSFLTRLGAGIGGIVAKNASLTLMGQDGILEKKLPSVNDGVFVLDENESMREAYRDYSSESIQPANAAIPAIIIIIIALWAAKQKPYG